MYACRLCKKLSNNSELVQPGGADCFPSWIMDYIHSHTYRHDSWNKDCLELKSASYLSGKSRAKMYKMPSKDRSHGNDTFWMMMAFESVRRLCLLSFVNSSSSRDIMWSLPRQKTKLYSWFQHGLVSLFWE